MSERSYTTPEVVKLGDAIELTEGGGSPVAEVAGSGNYYNANPPSAQDEITEGI